MSDHLTTVAKLEAGDRVELMDADGEHWLDAVTLTGDPEPCRFSACCKIPVGKADDGTTVYEHRLMDAPARLLEAGED